MALMLLPFLAPGAAAEDCDLRCRTGCYGTSTADMWKCEDDRRSCVASCRSNEGSSSGPGGQSAPARRAFGAIAYSAATGDYGYAFGHPGRGTAEQVALGHCRNGRERARDCRVLTWFWNQCAALAIAPDGSHGADHAPDAATADRAALRVCAGYGGVGCRVVQRFCSR